LTFSIFVFFLAWTWTTAAENAKQRIQYTSLHPAYRGRQRAELKTRSILLAKERERYYVFYVFIQVRGYMLYANKTYNYVHVFVLTGTAALNNFNNNNNNNNMGAVSSCN
jgi:hypothetical protein